MGTLSYHLYETKRVRVQKKRGQKSSDIFSTSLAPWYKKNASRPPLLLGHRVNLRHAVGAEDRHVKLKHVEERDDRGHRLVEREADVRQDRQELLSAIKYGAHYKI